MSKIFEIGEMDEFPEFEDYSSTRGKFKLMWSRLKWQYMLAGVGFFTLFVLFISFAALQNAEETSPLNPDEVDEPLPSSLQPNISLLKAVQSRPAKITKYKKIMEIPNSTPSSNANANASLPSPIPHKNDVVYYSKNDTFPGQGYVFEFEGKEDNFIFLGLNQPWWDVSTVPVHLRVRNAILNATEFVYSLKGTRKFVSIDLEVTGLAGNFTPVLLPELLDYSYNYIGPYDGSAGAWYQSPEKLKSLLFFEKTNSSTGVNTDAPNGIPISTWDIRDIANIGVNVSVVIRGTHLLNINRPLGFLVLNVDYAWEILERTQGPFEKLVMVSCPFAVPPMKSSVISLPKELKYLNLYNITKPDSAEPMVPVRFHQLLASSRQLETLLTYHNSVGSEEKIPLNLLDLPPTLKRMSLRGIQLELDEASSTSFFSSVEDLTLAEGRISPEIIQNFESIFKNVKNLQLLLGNETVTNNQTDIIILVPKALKLLNVQKIFVTGLNWTKAMEMDEKSEPEQGLIQSLSSFGVPAGIENFVLTKVQSETQNSKFTSNIVSDDQVLKDKYKTFGFDDIESIEHYAANL